MSFISQISEINNLYWAWEKAKWLYQPGDIWFDELEVAAFEADLHNELLSIQKDIQENTYTVQKIYPVAFPKGSDEDGPRTRQTFWISVRDQVTWLAVVNILGRELDSKMPFWSYGNRLYISTFYEDNPETQKKELKFGYYRNTTKYTFRKWSQSWPLYRRHIKLTAKFISGKGAGNIVPLGNLEEKEPELLEVNDALEEEHPLKVQYLKPDYWDKELNGELFWAGLDLKNFYPQLNIKKVQTNIQKYLGEPDEALNNLIERLLFFPLDLTGWEPEEIQKIKLDAAEQYNHMPTGLFVAGFLANVALLEVDKIITEKLLANKDIAHFRFVDDHVILCTSFEKLTTWIKEYEKLIQEGEIGADFNAKKTQPSELSRYLELLGEETDKEVLDKALKDATSVTKLDPEFPSPLMTQTLAKVSKIACTEFQLLDPAGEQTLLADIEHLLITDFPDNELRKDTRVSFAARMLSNLVPQLTTNTDATYKLYRQIIELKAKRKGATAETAAAIDDEIKVAEESLKLHEKKALDDETKISNRAIKLLLKAVLENHEKVRLWTRVLEFSLRSGNSILLKILNEIQELKNKKATNDLSITFIHSLILQVLSQLLWKSFAIINNPSTSFKQKTRTTIFIDDLLSRPVQDYFKNNMAGREKIYEKNSYGIFRFTAGTVIYLLKEIGRHDYTALLNDYHFVDWRDEPETFCNKSPYSFGIWGWWLINHLPKNDDNEPPYLWDLISTRLNAGERIDSNIIQLFPAYLSKILLDGVESNKEIYQDNEGWLFDVRNGIIKRQQNPADYSILGTVNQKAKVLNNRLSLYEWINWTNQRHHQLEGTNEGHFIYDPRLSEWMALEITKQIASELSGRLTNLTFYAFWDKSIRYALCIHPNNFTVPEDWVGDNTPLTWERLRQIVNDKRIQLRANEELIYDKRFITSEGSIVQMYVTNNQNDSIISAIGALFICLISRKSLLPHRWNPIGHQQAWLGLARSSLKNISLSSFTRDIIEGCFSKRNRETAILKQLNVKNGMSVENDSSNDPPYFINVDELIRFIETSQKALESQQLSVSDHQPRQLIPISLKQMKREIHQEQNEI